MSSLNVELIGIIGTLLAGGIGLIALLAALLAAGAGLYFMLYAFGFFNYLGGKKKSVIPSVSKRELREKLLALNDPSKPYQIIKGEDTDLIAEWKIADAQWYGILNKSGLKVSYRAHILLDEERLSVRCYEEYRRIEWSAGLMGVVPSVHFEKSFFGGRIFYSKQYAIFIRRRNLHKRDVYGKLPRPEKLWNLGEEDGRIICPSLLHGFANIGAYEKSIGAESSAKFLLGVRCFPHGEYVDDFHVLQRHVMKCFNEMLWSGAGGAYEDTVAGLYNLECLGG